MADCELIAFITAIACGITKCLPDDDIALLAASLTQLGDTLATYLAQNELAQKRADERAKKRDADGQQDNKYHKEAGGQPGNKCQ